MKQKETQEIIDAVRSRFVSCGDGSHDEYFTQAEADRIEELEGERPVRFDLLHGAVVNSEGVFSQKL